MFNNLRRFFRIVSEGQSTITVNGHSYSGKNISIVGGKIVVDGVEDSASDLTGPKLDITITGSPWSVETSESLTIHGDVQGDVRADGKVTCGNVGNDVTSDSDVIVSGDVAGYVEAEGTVDCKNVGGDVTSDGDVSCLNVNGYIESEGNVEARDVAGDVSAEGDVRVRNVSGTIEAEGGVSLEKRQAG